MMDEMMGRIADECEEEVDEKLSSMIAVLEPTLVIILSVIVGTILLSVMLPLLELCQDFRRYAMWRKERERFYHGKRQHPLRNFCLSLLLFVCICSAFSVDLKGFRTRQDAGRRKVWKMHSGVV